MTKAFDLIYISVQSTRDSPEISGRQPALIDS